MPLFKWEGIDITGSICSGKEEASTSQELEKTLRTRGIAMLQAKKALFQAVDRAEQVSHGKKRQSIHELFFFSNLAELLDAGLFVSDAIALMAQQQKEKDSYFDEIKQKVNQGVPLSAALESYKISPLIISLVRAGEETASLTKTSRLIAQYLTQQQEFRSRIKTAIYMPAITFGFFVLMMLVIIFGLVPKIVTLFPEGTKLPNALRILSNISQLPKRPLFLLWLSAMFCCIGLFIFWLAHAGRSYLDAIMLQLPLVRTWVLNRNLANLLTSLGIMLEGGIPIARALPIASNGLTNSLLRNKFLVIGKEIEMGAPFSQAIRQELHLEDLATIMALGEQTGRLGQLVNRTARWYEKQCTDSLLMVTQVIQPTLIIILGLGIAGLIGSVYLPILELAQGIPQGI